MSRFFLVTHPHHTPTEAERHAVDMKFQGALEASVDFFTAESAFHPDLDRPCQRRVVYKHLCE